MEPVNMDESAAKFFQAAIETPSPSGFEEPIQALVHDYVSPYADDVRIDVHVNSLILFWKEVFVRGSFCGSSAAPRKSI